MKKSVTIKDIAALTGVSAMTVSYVLNNDPNQSISKVTRDKVIKAAKDLNYVPNYAARTLKSSESMTVGVVMGKTLSAERFANTLQGVREKLNNDGYNVLLCTPDRTTGIYPDYIEMYFAHYIDALIYMGRDNIGPSNEELKIIKEHKIPVVVFDCKNDSEFCSSVDFDYYSGAFDLTNNLIKSGTEKILYIRPDMNNPQENERQLGFVKALEHNGRKSGQIVEFSVKRQKIQFSDGATAEIILDTAIPNLEEPLSQYLKSYTKKDTILVSWGVYADSVLDIMNKNKIESSLAAMAEPPRYGRAQNIAKYCRMNHYKAGYRCAEIILDEIAQKGRNSKKEQIVLPLELVL